MEHPSGPVPRAPGWVGLWAGLLKFTLLSHGKNGVDKWASDQKLVPRLTRRGHLFHHEKLATPLAGQKRNEPLTKRPAYGAPRGNPWHCQKYDLFGMTGPNGQGTCFAVKRIPARGSRQGAIFRSCTCANGHGCLRIRRIRRFDPGRFLADS